MERRWQVQAVGRVVWAASLCVAVLGTCAGVASAQNPPPLKPGDELAIGTRQGPVIGSTRVIGMGGAYSAIAEGAVGVPFNPVSYAQRPYHSNSAFDWDVAFDFLVPGVFQDDSFDFDGNGRSSAYARKFITFILGGIIQYKNFGIGAHVALQSFDVRDAANTLFSWQLATGRFGVAYGLARHQLLFGASLVLAGFNVYLEDSASSGRPKLLAVSAAGFEAGALWRPARWPFRAALTVRSPLLLNADNSTCDAAGCPQGLVLPRHVELPWEVRLGFAYTFSHRRFNPTPGFIGGGAAGGATPARPASRPASLPTSQRAVKPPTLSASQELSRGYRGGRYVTLSLDVALVGRSNNAIGIDGLLEQIRERVGESITVAVHFGAESELLRRRLRVRVGSYWEPGRYASTAGRIHGTVAVAVRLFDVRIFGARSLLAAAAFDGAARYTNVALSIGFWH